MRVPIIPNAGAYFPKLSRTIFPCIWRSIIASSSVSMMTRMSSGSVPSTAILIPRIINSSVISPTWFSSERIPSRRAISAYLTMSLIVSAGSAVCPKTAFSTSLGSPSELASGNAAITAPVEPPNTTMTEGILIIPMGFPPPRRIAKKQQIPAIMSPPTVAISTRRPPCTTRPWVCMMGIDPVDRGIQARIGFWGIGDGVSRVMWAR